MSLGLFDQSNPHTPTLFEERKKRYDDDSFFTNQGFDLQGENSYDWMPEGTKLFYNKDSNRYGFKDMSGAGYQADAGNLLKDGSIDGDLFKKEYDSLRDRGKAKLTSDRFSEMYPYYSAEGRGQSNLHAGSLRDKPFAGTYSQIGADDTYGGYNLTNRRRGSGFITDVRDNDGNVLHSYSSPSSNHFGGALDWIDNHRKNEYSNLNGALQETDAGTSVNSNLEGALATQPTASEVITETISPTDLSLETIDYKGLPAAEQALLIEQIEDAATRHDWRSMAAEDKFNLLKEYLPNLTSARLAVLTEQITDAQSAYNILIQGSLTKENEITKASSDLAQAEMDSNLARYRNITDTLRGDRLSSERAGEGRGNNFADRLLLQAEMSAADKYEQLENASKLSDAQRKYGATVSGAGERAEAVKLLADTTLSNNVSQVALEEKTSIFQALQDKATAQQAIADELAQVLGTTQEKTLPAVKMAELIIEQASQEGKMEIANAEEKSAAVIDSARELLSNSSLLQSLSEQLGDEALVLGAEYTEEQKDFVQRIQNLKNIPGLVNAILDRVPADMFAVYTSLYEQIGAIWAAGVVAGLVDQDGYLIPDTSFAETVAGDSAFEELFAIQEQSGEDGVEGAVNTGVDMLGDVINGLFKNFGKGDE